MSRLLLLLNAIAMMMATGNSIANEGPLHIENPHRTVGYTLGDVLVQRIHVVEQDTIISADTDWPPLERTNRWLERIASHIDKSQQTLTLHYQIVNAPLAVTTAQIPVIAVPLSTGGTHPADSWSFTLSPLLPLNADTASALPLMQPDTAPAPPDMAAGRRALQHRLTLLGTLLAAWALWWFWQNHRDSHHLPFAHAWQRLRTLRHGSPHPEQAWLALHQAFNQFAGHTVSTGSLPMLFQRAPWLAQDELQVAAFFQASDQRFFAKDTQGSSSNSRSDNALDLTAISQALYRAEKRHTPVVHTAGLRWRKAS